MAKSREIKKWAPLTPQQREDAILDERISWAHFQFYSIYRIAMRMLLNPANDSQELREIRDIACLSGQAEEDSTRERIRWAIRQTTPLIAKSGKEIK